MTKRFQIYKCEVCGNIIEVLHNGKGELVCCGQLMQLLKEKNKEEGNDKHKPIIERNKEGVAVKVSSIEHPMEKEHYIEWIEISTNQGRSKKFLKSGEKPGKKFPVKAKKVSSRSYCNMQGLWNDS